MRKKTLPNFIEGVRNCNPDAPWDPSLLLGKDDKLKVFYAPFEHINTQAKVAICGITPGITQACEALDIAKTGLLVGSEISDIQSSAKQAASFKGFRKPLTQMLDLIGLNNKLDIESCDSLFGKNSNMVHYTSAIRYPTLLANGSGYNGTPRVNKNLILKQFLELYLAEEIETLGSECLWIPLGKGATDALKYMVDIGILQPQQLLSGLPHPSGANAERVAYFLGNKPKEKLSVKVNPAIIDSAKSRLIEQLQAGV
ncbi:hypothetical protein JCM19236_2705 [Vibrio sp. JCM 19236]|nr:hypothetical protein JCM19236_2705 [Vibrio sp. JCM 19236]